MTLEICVDIRIRLYKYMICIVGCSRLRLYCGRLVSNILVLGLLGGSGFLIYYVADLDTDVKISSIEVDDEPEELIQKIYERYRASTFVLFSSSC
jgi:hypothetical protein